MKFVLIFTSALLITVFLAPLSAQHYQQGETMDVWFEGTIEIDCNIQRVKLGLENLGETYAGIVSLMPGLSSVELVDEGTDFVIIQTNEGLMKRTNIAIRTKDESVIVEFDEEYKAGAMLTTNSHFKDEFTISVNGVYYHTVISNIKAPGFMGFFYRNFGSSNTGNAFLRAFKTHFEEKTH